jgi:IrrE N-terminal-like domain
MRRGLHQALDGLAGKWRVDAARARAERQASLQRCRKLLGDLPPIPPGSMHALCAAVRTPDGRPIRVHSREIPPYGPAALIASLPDEYVIIVDERTSRFSRWRRLAHEVAHIVLDHLKETMSAADQRALWFPDLDPAFLNRVMAFTPCRYPTQYERDADALGGRLLAAVLHGVAPKQADGTLDVEAVPLLGRRDALYRQFWELRPLHLALVTAVPGAALFPPSPALADLVRVTDLEDRVTRQAVEIGDVWGLLQNELDPAVGSVAREHARHAGLPDSHIEATADAAMLAAAARAVRPDTPLTLGGVACAGSVDVHAELARLRLVARAFTGPIVRRLDRAL